MIANLTLLFVVHSSLQRDSKETKLGISRGNHLCSFSRTRRQGRYNKVSGNNRFHYRKGSFICVQSSDPAKLHLQGNSLYELNESFTFSRSKIRIAIPSKGDIGEDTKSLLKESGLEILLHNPRQYWATVRDFPEVEVWLQRPTDIVRRVQEGQVDIGFVGYDIVTEYQDSPDSTLLIHEGLGYGGCKLGVGIPMSWVHVTDMNELARFSEERNSPLLITTKYPKTVKKFLQEKGMKNYRLLHMDGALEAATQMGCSDLIIDLISSGTTLRENLLKEITEGTVLESDMIMIGSPLTMALNNTFGHKVRSFTRELLERIESHLAAKDHFSIIANIKGSSPGDVARKIGSQVDLKGMDGPTVSPVIPPRGFDSGMYAIGVVVKKNRLYKAIEQLRGIGGSGVCVLPVSYVFEKKSARWERIIKTLGLDGDS
ncbi:ATP phosphoribosyltransferase, chloroplastic [Galdieria sulphuraria]|uniref:ATP phosphoribosyltransferase n=1 Tax=Galdieria sulphuraria TaxID=130081 RepID=M2Y527_GALSU|nr:ATP phosphoribosyltransferase [Galdieria sulphuraria]EME30954.1 ATP phosphoribosyltransferase [Galdieria sulphuraria]GJD10974.1 ATP phosphoribosyltransferase, chloroplastic [Galdieria sulphuraria]|eukprot:XP_005707474.1 ATP phosphoribosyltransferase [Galdieria sulphuraria]